MARGGRGRFKNNYRPKIDSGGQYRQDRYSNRGRDQGPSQGNFG